MKNVRPGLLASVVVPALLLMAVGVVRVRAQGLLLNGSFEGPSLAASSFVAGGGTSWTTGGPTGQVFVISNDYGSYGNTPYGTQYLDLNREGTSDSQVVAGLVAGQTYTLSANFAEIQASTTPRLTLSVSGVASASSTFIGTVGGPYGSGAFPFQSAAISFTALTSGSATITLTNSSDAATGSQFFPALAIDNVLLVNVPEPATTALLALGAGVLAGGAVRRHGKRA